MSEEPQAVTTNATDAAQLGKNLFEQWKTIIMHPKQFFESMPLQGGFAQPVIFVSAMAVLAGIGVVLGSIFNPFAAIELTVKTVLGTLIGSFLGALITWILCKLFGGTGNYEQTYRACAYSAAPHAFAIIPKVGAIGSLYGIYLLYLGIKRAHGLSDGKAAAVVAIEVLAAVGLIILLVGVLMAAFFAMKQAH
jgi:hypothetical protein